MFKNYTVVQFYASITRKPLHERDEIMKYNKDEIYFLGKAGRRKLEGNKVIYDDEFGRYIVINGEHIYCRYEVLKCIGQGSYGTVIAAFDHKLKQKVAIKIIRSGTDFEKYCIEEVMTYEFLNLCLNKECKELIRMLSHFNFRNHLCIVFDMCSQDLLTVFNKYILKDNYMPLKWLQLIVASMTKGLSALHELNLIHGDFKLNNICLQKNSLSNVTIIDLGNAKFGSQMNKILYAICYRPPEVILHLECGPSADVWAMGCLVYLMATGQELFQGYTEDQQIIEYIQEIGVPPLSMVKNSDVGSRYFRSNGAPIYCTTEVQGEYRLVSNPSMENGRCYPGTKNAITDLKSCCPDLADFILKCVMWDPKQRITASEAMHHKFLLKRSLPQIDFNRLRGSQRSRDIGLSLSTSNISGKNRNNNPQLEKTTSLVHIGKNNKDIYKNWQLIQAKYFRRIQIT